MGLVITVLQWVCGALFLLAGGVILLGALIQWMDRRD